jgi:hypothetical protein
VPVPEHDSEKHATVTMGAVSQRYPQTKSLMRQVRFLLPLSRRG